MWEQYDTATSKHTLILTITIAAVGLDNPSTMEKLQQVVQTTPLCSRCGHEFVSVTGGPDLAALARSAYVPTTDFDRGSLQLGLANLESRLSQCEDELARVEKAARLLRLQKASLEETAADVKALLAPIRWVPPEVLSEIAVHTVPPRWFIDSIGANVWLFSQVCHAWREVAFSLHQYWSCLILPHCQGLKGDSLIDAVATYLHRSGQHLLSVGTMRPRPLSTSWEDPDRRVWQLISTAADRIHYLGLIPSRTRFPFEVALPALTQLAFHGHFIRRSEILPFPVFHQTPRIHTLRFIETSLPDMSPDLCTQLRVLEAQCPLVTPRDVGMLGLCINLVYLRLADMLHDVEISLPDVCLPSLETLSVHAWMAVRFCPLIVAPRLRRFILSTHYSCFGDDYQKVAPDWVVEHDIAQALRRILRPVQTVVLHDMLDYPADLLLAILSIPDDLTSCHLRTWLAIGAPGGGAAASPLHRGLAQKLIWDDNRPTLPHLKVMTFGATGETSQFSDWDKGDIEVLLDLVQSRWASNPSRASLEILGVDAAIDSTRPPMVLKAATCEMSLVLFEGLLEPSDWE